MIIEAMEQNIPFKLFVTLDAYVRTTYNIVFAWGPSFHLINKKILPLWCCCSLAKWNVLTNVICKPNLEIAAMPRDFGVDICTCHQELSLFVSIQFFLYKSTNLLKYYRPIRGSPLPPPAPHPQPLHPNIPLKCYINLHDL
jgi:hypothetical protein